MSVITAEALKQALVLRHGEAGARELLESARKVLRRAFDKKEVDSNTLMNWLDGPEAAVVQSSNRVNNREVGGTPAPELRPVTS